MPKTATDRIVAAQAAFDAGFLSMAAKKRAQEELSRAYTIIRDGCHGALISHANRTPGLDSFCDARTDFFRAHDLPFELHQVRPRHVEIIAGTQAFDPVGKWNALAKLVEDMIALRLAIKEAPLAPVPAKPALEVKAEAIRRDIAEEFKRLRTMYIEGLELARHFGKLPVSINAHWVQGHKGAVFVRHFFYLHGKLTPLQTILAIADTLEREQEGR